MKVGHFSTPITPLSGAFLHADLHGSAGTESWTNVGFAMVPENNGSTAVGPIVFSGAYCSANTSIADHHNRFIVGTVWNDLNGDGDYDANEGLNNVTVMPDSGT